jgi:hypothetical protein
MHIIFGDAVKEIPDSYTVLELDTFDLKTENKTVTAYCVVEKIPLSEFSTAAANKELHSNLIKYYQKQHWDFCEQAINALMGKWNGELDTFYLNLLERINTYKNNELDTNWNGHVSKTV